jgi:hypothetical protein
MYRLEDKMSHDARYHLDVFLLKPLWTIFLGFGIVYAVREEFFNSVVFFIASFFGIARIRAGLLPERFRIASEPQNAGEPTSACIIDNPEHIPWLAGRAIMRLAFLQAAVFAIISWHAGAKWWCVIGGAVAAYIGSPILTGLILLLSELISRLFVSSRIGSGPEARV